MKQPYKLDLMRLGAMSLIAGVVLTLFGQGAAAIGGAVGGACLMVYAYFKKRTPRA